MPSLGACFPSDTVIFCSGSFLMCFSFPFPAFSCNSILSCHCFSWACYTLAFFANSFQVYLTCIFKKMLAISWILNSYCFSIPFCSSVFLFFHLADILVAQHSKNGICYYSLLTSCITKVFYM